MKNNRRDNMVVTEQFQSNIAGIPIEKCNIEKIKQSNVGMLYLTDNRSGYISGKRQHSFEVSKTPKDTIKVEGVPVIYVYRGYLVGDKKYLTEYYMIVDDIWHRNKNRLVVVYNSQNKRYYMSIQQLENLHRKDFFPNIIIRSSNKGSEPLCVGEFRQFSELAAYGYKVGKNGLSKDKRQGILKHVIKNTDFKQYEIISLLTGNIALREARRDRNFSKAISDWREDIDFVNSFEI